MKHIFLLTYLLSASLYFSAQNEITYCEKTTWTKLGSTRIETYCKYGRLKNVRINKYGDTTQVLGQTFDSLGRAITEYNNTYEYNFKWKGRDINGYLVNIYRDTNTKDVTSVKHIRKSEYKILYKDTSNIQFAFEYYKGDSLITFYNKNKFNEHGDEIFDGWHNYTKYEYDDLDRINWLESVDTTENYHSKGKYTYDVNGHIIQIDILQFNYENSIWIESKNVYEYDENGHQVAAYEYENNKVVDETHHIFNSKGHCIRSYGSGYDEWEMLFERIPCE